MRAAIDIGGTFTDCLIHDETGAVRTFKVPTTPYDPTVGLLAALERAARAEGRSLPEFLGRLELLVHGTTLGTNTLLTRTGAQVGVITTAGFRDVLELRRGVRNLGRSMFDQFHPPYRPLVPRALRRGVLERVRYTGEVLVPLSEEDVERAAHALAAAGCDAIAVGFLHGHINPDHELTAKKIVQKVAPEAYVVCSHEVLRTRGEFERFSTTVVSAYIGPTVARYLRRLEAALRHRGFAGGLLIVQGSGLMQTVDECITRAVGLLVSGPAAAPSAAVSVTRQRRRTNAIEIDMGGTSFDICLIRDLSIPTTTEAWMGEERVATKAIEVATIGAGGGSIAWIDSLGLLRVGPQSSGADPGPAAYGRSDLPTVTDADIVLGYVPVDYFLGGEMTVDAELARDSLSAIAERLSLDIPGAALAVNTTVNANMADAITEVCTKKGHDVRDFVLVAGGGAGGIHAAPVAALLHLPEIVFPPAGALLSAQGMLIMDLGQELARSEAWLGGEGVSEARLKRAFEEMIETQQLTFARAGVDTSAAKFVRSVEMRYEGQYHAVEVQLPDRKIDASTLEALLSAFHDRYRALYGYSMPGRAVELMQLHVRGSIPSAVRKVPVTAPASAAPDPGEARRGSRSCVTASGPVDFPVYDRDLLRPATRFHGPALIDSTTTTVLVPEGFAAEVDQYLNIVVRMVPTGDAAARSNHLVAVAR